MTFSSGFHEDHRLVTVEVEVVAPYGCGAMGWDNHERSRRSPIFDCDPAGMAGLVAWCGQHDGRPSVTVTSDSGVMSPVAAVMAATGMQVTETGGRSRVTITVVGQDADARLANRSEDIGLGVGRDRHLDRQLVAAAYARNVGCHGIQPAGTYEV